MSLQVQHSNVFHIRARGRNNFMRFISCLVTIFLTSCVISQFLLALNTYSRYQYHPDQNISEMALPSSSSSLDGSFLDQTKTPSTIPTAANIPTKTTTTTTTSKIKMTQPHHPTISHHNNINNDINNNVHNNTIHTTTKEKPHLQPLNCEKYNGPSKDVAQEMVYWWKIPMDEEYLNLFQRESLTNRPTNHVVDVDVDVDDAHDDDDDEKFLLFEPDLAGWNNYRMALETIITLGISMGRTIVLPPKKKIYLLWENKTGKQKRHFTVSDFFHLDQVEMKHNNNGKQHIKFISMEEYLNRFGMKGLLLDKNITTSGASVIKFPPYNRTNWDRKDNKKEMWEYIESTSYMDSTWKPLNSITYFPKNSTKLGPQEMAHIKNMTMSVYKQKRMGHKKRADNKNPIPSVDASMEERLIEHSSNRRSLLFYDDMMQKEKFVHFKYDGEKEMRFLIPFYVLHFFEDWKQALWTKRFVRDHLRYNDELMCAAARVVGELRKRAREYDRAIDNVDGLFHSMHIRRADFKQQYGESVLSVDKLIEASNPVLGNHTSKTIYIATDEKNRTFFEPFKKQYQVFFMDDFEDILDDVNSNYFPLIDQLISSRGDIFFGTHYSTFTSYINRLRGYYSWRDKIDGYLEGRIKSYYFNPPSVKSAYQQYFHFRRPFWAYEFTEAWFDIDKDVDF